MKRFNQILFFVLAWLLGFSVQAQQRKAVSFQQQVQSQKTADPTANVTQPTFRILAAGEYANGNLDSLNQLRAANRWNGTTTTGGSFNNLSGFNIGLGYHLGPGFLGLEFNRDSQFLGATNIASGGFAVQDTLEIETVQLTYDWVWQNSVNQSYELGLSAGTATKFKFGQLITGSYTENIYWQDNPIVGRFRFAYNYHFSQQVRLRFGLAYELATTDNIKADANHASTMYGQPITSGRRLTDSQGHPTTIDMSGVRVDLGLVIGI
ncbi:MAG: hypothetical protein ACXVAX_03095 [Pseudobdellovibrio sp.]